MQTHTQLKIDPVRKIFRKYLGAVNLGSNMQNYYFFNKSTGEIVEQVFLHFKQVERFLEISANFELVSGPIGHLPVRGTRKID